MKFLSIDIETTGLNENENQIIEIGGVVDDLKNPKPINDLPEFHCYVTHETYHVSEYCLGLHGETGIFEDLSNRKEEHTYLELDQVAYHLGKFIYYNYLTPEEQYLDNLGDPIEWNELYNNLIEKKEPRNIIPLDDFFPISVIAAGKNFNSLDSDFLGEVPNLTDIIYFYHRVIDPGSMYVKLDDESPPNLKTCLERAGFDDEVPHNAVDDSKLVVKLIRNHFGIN